MKILILMMLLVVSFTGLASDLDSSQSAWMSQLDEDVSVHDLSIPGSHDTMTYGYNSAYPTSWWAKTQRKSLAIQLESGIRFLDFRVYCYNNRLRFTHGKFPLDLYLDTDGLRVVSRFLERNPTEAVFIRIQKSPSISADSCSKTEPQILKEYFEDERVNPYIYDEKPAEKKLKDIQKHMVIFIRHLAGPEGHEYVRGYNNIANEQDHYSINFTWEFKKKANKIKDFFNQIPQSGNEKFQFNFISGVGFSFTPIQVAWGTAPYYSHALRVGMNGITKDYLRSSESKSMVGIVVADFPDAEMVELIIDKNKKKGARTLVEKKYRGVSWCDILCQNWAPGQCSIAYAVCEGY